MAEHNLERRFKVDAEVFGQRLEGVRRRFGMKQYDIADYLEVTRSYISNLERGANKPGLSVTRGIRTYFAEKCKFVKPLDFWVEGIDYPVQNQKEDQESTEKLLEMLKDKDEIIQLLKEKVGTLQGQLAKAL